MLREIAIDPETSGGVAASARSDPASRAGEMDLANALADLGEADRVIVGLRYAAGLTSAEIATMVGMSAGGVRARLARLLDRLRKELDDDAPAN